MGKLKKSIDKAKEVLENNSINSAPVPVEEIVDDYGIKLQFIDLKDKSDEISGLYDHKSKIIYINVNDAPVRQRFTIAHELGHALLHAPQLEKDPNLGIFYRKPLGDKIFESVEEREANCFAAYLLVPENLLRKLYETCKSPTILADIFNVSRQVIEIHLKNLGLTR